MENRLLVIVAHPDDEVLGCGGTVALRVAQNWEVRLMIMTGGVTGRHAADVDRKALLSTGLALQAESEVAARTLGFAKVIRHDFPDNRMDSISRMDLSLAIVDELKAFRPTTIFTHHPGDYNWDHTIVFDAVMMAARSSPGEFAPKEILTFEVPSSTERSWQSPERAFHPNVFVNIKSTVGTKKKALQDYKSECREYPHPRSVQGVEFLARKRGLEVGIEFAEAFALVRRVEG